jgi:cupin fold WbuC family metalloprotein
MSEKIYSKVDPSILLCAIIRRDDITETREDISPEKEPLQVACKKIKAGTNFKPHKHNILKRETTRTQESWVFLQGKVRASFYDIDDRVILVTELGAGDCAVVFRAGHSFDVLEDDTILYEFKNGPYFGVEQDKTYLDEKH